MDKETARLLTARKSPGLAVVLALLFGSLGLFYASIFGGLLMSVATVAAVALTILTAGLGLPVLVLVWVMSVLWAAVATSRYNRALVKRSMRATASSALLAILLLTVAGCGSGGGSSGASAGGSATLRLTNNSAQCTLSKVSLSTVGYFEDYPLFVSPGQSRDFEVPAGEYDVVVEVAFLPGCLFRSFTDFPVAAGQVNELIVDPTFP